MMVTCTKYKCDKCGKEFEESSKLESTWFGDNEPKHSLWHIYSFDVPTPKSKKKQINPFARLELGDLCKDCFKDAKQLLEQWKKIDKKILCNE